MPPAQIIAGQSYAPYSPEWYTAHAQDAIGRARIGGTAEGTGESAYLSQLTPSLAGLYSAVGGNQRTGTNFSLPSSVGYQPGGSFGGASTPGAVMYPSGPTSSPSADPAQVSAATLLSGSAAEAPPPSTIAPVDFTGANSAAFARAKDQAAKTAGASMTGLQQALASRGMGGAGYEAGQIGGTLGREANTIGEAGRAQAEKEAELSARAAEANLSAGVAQRGQTIGAQQGKAARELSAREAAFSGGINQRGQDIQSRESAANLAAEKAHDIYSGGIAQRGQDIGVGESAASRAADAAHAQYSGAIAQRGQDIQARQADADLAERNAALKSSQTLQVLQSILSGRGHGGVPGYVY